MTSYLTERSLFLRMSMVQRHDGSFNLSCSCVQRGSKRIYGTTYHHEGAVNSKVEIEQAYKTCVQGWRALNGDKL